MQTVDFKEDSARRRIILQRKHDHPDHNRSTLSKGQKTFNSLIQQIEKRRLRLRAWESVTPTFQQRYVNDFLPLEQNSTDLQIEMVHCLDRAYEQRGRFATHSHPADRR